MSNPLPIKPMQFGYFREAKYKVEDQTSDNPHILGRVWVVASKCDEATFNNTVYSKILWETLFKSKDFTDRMKRKLVMGNLDHPACFLDTDFGILTESGWKQFPDVRIGEMIQTLGVNDSMELNPIESITNEPYKGPGYRFHHRSMDFSVTPNHRFLVEHRYGNREYVTAEEIFNDRQKFSHSRILKTSTYEGDIQDTISIPSVIRRKGSGPTGKNDIENDLIINSELFCSFLGIWLSEGSISNEKYSVKIHQKKESNVVLIRELINKIGLPWRENKSINGCVTFVINDQRLHTYLKTNCGDSCYNKRIPADIKRLHPAALDQLVEWFILGDGRNQKIEDGYSANRKNLFSVSHGLVDDLHELVVKCGGSANVSLPTSPTDYMFAGHLIETKNKKQLYQLNISSSKYVWLTSHVKIDKIEHDGGAYCVSVKNSNFYFRKGLISFWTGNSPKQKARDATHSAVEVDIRGNEVWVKFEIFNTPDGRILWTLLGAGVVLGVSSRSTGTDEEKGGKIYLIPSTFKLMGWDFVVDESAFGSMFKEFSEEKKDTIVKVINEEKGKAKNQYLVDMVESGSKAMEEQKRVVNLEADKFYAEQREIQEEKVRLEERLVIEEKEKKAAVKEKVRLESILKDRDSLIALKEEGAIKYREEIQGLTGKSTHLEEKLKEKEKTIEEMKTVIDELKNRKSISISVQKNFNEEKEEHQSTVARAIARNKGIKK